jgi:hypothetical protein
MCYLQKERITEYGFVLPGGKLVSFANAERANECKANFFQHREEIIQYTKGVEDLQFQEFKELEESRKNKQPELAQLSPQGKLLADEQEQLKALLAELKPRVAQEKLLGSSPNPGGQPANDGKTDWARVIETNATRIGALATMFFLVTILVPQYRYNIRMASFYEVRSDSLGMLPEQMSAEDFDKVA